MELDATTFVLEIINFLVLLWLLQRFLFKPARAALAAREVARKNQAEQLQMQRAALDAGLLDLELKRQELSAQREGAERELANAIAVQRQQRLIELNEEIASEREKAQVRLAQEQSRTQEQEDRELQQRAAAFVAEYLRRLACAELEAALLGLFLSDLGEQSAQAREALRHGSAEHPEQTLVIEITTAFPPPQSLRERIEAQLTALVAAPVRSLWRLDPALLAGICVNLPEHSLEASLRRGVDAFVSANE